MLSSKLGNNKYVSQTEPVNWRFQQPGTVASVEVEQPASATASGAASAAVSTTDESDEETSAAST
jgi:hypothetical protein